MKNIMLNVIKCIIILAVVAGLFFILNNKEEEKNNNTSSKLIIFGDNIDKKYNPFVENDNIYISLDTISGFIDENIFYDEATKKIIITNEEYLYKFKVGDKKATKNLEEYDLLNAPRSVGDEIYLELSTIKDIYNIKSEYDKETNTISIDKKDLNDINLNYNQVNLYSDINTKSEIIEVLNKENTVNVYVDSLKHNRWYKVKTDSGKIGYIEKAAVTLNKENNEETENNNNNANEKMIMFWQYGSNLEKLGDKIDGVNVVMPTWYSLEGESGAITIKYDKDYYKKAKENGYQIWPIITNSFDSEDINGKEITSKIVNSEREREELIRNIVGIIQDNKLDGINIDFENMKEEDKYLYTQFLRELYPVVKSVGAKLSVDVYFTSYIDRKGVGKACDYLMFMGYDQRGEWSKEAGSISEIAWTEGRIESLINDSDVDPSKIILGVPFYTRLWKINSDGTFSTNVYSMNNSNEFIEKYGLTPTVDEVSGQNYVETKQDDITYKLWIEDAYSMGKRAELVNKYNLGGITAWQKGFETDDIWQVLKEKLK